MTGAFVCELCKKACERSKKGRTPPRSARSTPSGRGGSGTPRSSCPPKRECPDKPVYVAADPSDQTCIVVGSNLPGGSSCSGKGNGSGGGGGGGAVWLRFPGSTTKLKVCLPDRSKTNGGSNSGSKDHNCIQIMGNSIVKTGNGELEIVPCNAKAGNGGGSGGVHISVARSGGGGCGGESGGNAQLSFSTEKCGQPSITCELGCKELEITYGPDKRKLDMNHCKETVASMIHRRLTELEIEKKLADSSRSDIHERR